MTKYLVQDLLGTMKYASYGIVLGCLVYVLIYVFGRKYKEEKKFSLWGLLFCVYFAMLLFITFFSRESGSTQIDLKIGSSLGINIRNDAYVIENILLFIPYGYLIPMVWKIGKKWYINLFLGLFTSLVIESLQLITGRGIFQIDDIITNTMGMVVGYFLFGIMSLCLKFIKKDSGA